MSHQHTCILLFARTPESEIQYKVLADKQKQNLQIQRQLFIQTKAIVQSVDKPYFIITEKQQTGNSFGQRFSNAIESLFKKGFDNVIALGADCPHINRNILQRAIQNIGNKESTLGPTKDGGLYLLSISKHQFDRLKFASIPWESSLVYKAYCAYLQSLNSSIRVLNTLSDIDNADDFRSFDFSKTTWLFNKLKGLQTQLSECICIAFSFQLQTLQLLLLRGPPIFTHPS